jgi:hypothetical protein
VLQPWIRPDFCMAIVGTHQWNNTWAMCDSPCASATISGPCGRTTTSGTINGRRAAIIVAALTGAAATCLWEESKYRERGALPAQSQGPRPQDIT